jgi:hypothetical protein
MPAPSEAEGSGAKNPSLIPPSADGVILSPPWRAKNLSESFVNKNAVAKNLSQSFTNEKTETKHPTEQNTRRGSSLRSE